MFAIFQALKDTEISQVTCKFSHINITRLRKNVLPVIALKRKIKRSWRS